MLALFGLTVGLSILLALLVVLILVFTRKKDQAGVRQRRLEEQRKEAAAFMQASAQSHQAPVPVPEVVTLQPPKRIRPDFTGKRQIKLDAGRGFTFDIVGEASYLDALLELAAGRLIERPGEPRPRVIEEFVVVPEPTNPFDPNAIAVLSPTVGHVGYFGRGDAIAYRGLAERLAKESAIGVCRGRLTGGWEEDVNIGVRLSLKPAAFFEGKAERLVPTLEVPDSMWRARRRVPLPAGRKFSLNLIGEDLCQPALRAVVGERSVTDETVVVELLLVPGDPVVLCSYDHGAVGRLSKSDTERYADLVAKLAGAGAAGLVDGWIFDDEGELEVRLSLPGPKRALDDLVMVTE